MRNLGAGEQRGWLVDVQPVLQLFDMAFQVFDARDELITMFDLLRRVLVRIAIGLDEWMRVRGIEPVFLCFELL